MDKEIRVSLKICDVGGQTSKGTKMLASYLHGANVRIDHFFNVFMVQIFLSYVVL